MTRTPEEYAEIIGADVLCSLQPADRKETARALQQPRGLDQIPPHRWLWAAGYTMDTDGTPRRMKRSPFDAFPELSPYERVRILKHAARAYYVQEPML
jgi:hypothetical protein